MGLFNKSKNASGSACIAVQTSSVSTHPFGRLNNSVSLNHGSYIYSMLCQSVPIIDVAISKIVRLCSGFKFETGNEKIDSDMNEFFENISVGGNQQGINMFVSAYLEQLLTYGSAVGEMIADDSGFYALYNGELSALDAKRAQNNFDIEFYSGNKKLERQDLILFSALNPKPGEILGTSILQGLPFVADILLKIYNTIGQNWEHAGNLRYAVTYKPEKEGIDGATAKERAKQIAGAWSEAMGSKDTVKDFVAVGDVSIKVIGADNVVLDSEVPVRQLLEQIVAKTGLPPYMLGLSWSTTERMSAQQADILTSELEYYRMILTPVLTKIGRKYLSTYGYAEPLKIEWNTITLQDETEHSKARLYDAQARKIETEAEV